MTEYRLSDDDFDRWAERGVITAQQRDAILDDLRSRPRDEGLTVTILAYYAGGLLILIAYGIFLAVQWEQLSSGARVFISGASFVFFAIVSQVLLRSRRFELPGELLQVVAVAVVPLLMFSALDAAGVWPDDPGYTPFDYRSARESYQFDLTWARLALGGATLLAAAVAFRVSRSPFVLVAAIASITALFVDVSLLVQRPGPDYEWRAGQSVTVGIVGAATFVAGVVVRGRTERDYAIWLYAAGLVGLTVGLGSQAIFRDETPVGWGLLWLAVALIVLALSIPLQQRLLAAAGLAGVFAYFAKLVFYVFESANAALALIVLGLLVLGAGMLYQRLSERAFSAAAPRPSPPVDSSVH